MAKQQPKIEVFPVRHIRLGKPAGFHWRLRGANGEIVCSSSGDPSPLKRGATARARRACRLMADIALGFPLTNVAHELPSGIPVVYVDK